MSLFIKFTNGSEAICHFHSRYHLEKRLSKFVLLGWMTEEEATNYINQWRAK